MEPGAAALYIGTFAARADAYVLDSRVHIGAPITEAMMEQALTTGRESISGYMANRIGSDAVSQIAALDFDHTEPEDIYAVKDTLIKLGIHPLLVGSRRGAHLWVQFSRPGPASIIRKALTHAIKLTDPAILLGVEIFPKRSDSDWGVGALRMPLMRHPKTGERYPGQVGSTVLTTPEDILLAFDTTDWNVLSKLVSALPPQPVEYPRGLGAYRRPSTIAPGSAVSILQGLGVEAVAGRGTRCPFHDDHHASLSVAHDDQRVWCKTPTCDAYNGGRGLGTLGMARLIETRKAR